MEIRIYYESLEQAEFFIKPMLKKALLELKVKKFNIILIEKVKQSYNKNGKLSKKYAKKISEILIQKNPDIIISIIKNNIEIPIVILEFSTAVFTKDHELQRTDNFNIALQSGAIYIKISPITKNSGSHGGDISYQYLEPYALFYKKYGELSFHINWNVEQNNHAILEKNEIYKSIPAQKEELESLLKIILKTYIENISINNWKQNFDINIENDNIFYKWLKKLKNLNDFEDITTINTSRMMWEKINNKINKKNVFTLKLNRMGHAMDPERGMLNYYSTFYKNNSNTFIAKLIFSSNTKSWYKDTPNEKEIEKIINNNFKNKLDLIKCLILGLSLPNGSELEKIVKENESKTLIDITEYINNNILSFNISMRNIIKNSDILNITDNTNFDIYLTWEPQVYREHSHDECPDITQIIEKNYITEDDVTFITIHNFFKENDIKVLSVSYPGAQSDMPILPQPTKGRKQQRIYIDAIGIKDNNLIFQENKGPYSKSKINDDIKKIIKFKSEINYKKALIEFKRKNQLKTDKLYIGIGFGEPKKSMNNINLELDLNDIDYFFVLSKDMLSWKIFSSLNNDKDIFKKKQGKIKKIKIYTVTSCQ